VCVGSEGVGVEAEALKQSLNLHGIQNTEKLL